jgi:hypothetical protein
MLGKILGISLDFKPVLLSQIVLDCPGIRTKRRTQRFENARLISAFASPPNYCGGAAGGHHETLA